ncbi:hypothetical protein GCM10011354_06740 [Egicoccus halophilus]|uniref:DUF4012 domain-containing protein n=1 Tax=Egicoccus halophilus TaxID=1670830 RepID=A0A8J3ACS0_9ACTN|nr:hypothetical protein GCM10011354_06740 [Egicoccus halophilus]
MVALGAVLVVWGVAAGVLAGTAALELRETRAQLSATERALRSTDLSGARASLARATEGAGTAASRLGSPLLAPARALPVVGDDLRFTVRLSERLHEVGAPATELLAVASAIVHDERDSGGVGVVPVAYVQELTPPLRASALALRRAVNDVGATAEHGLLGPVLDVRTQFLEVAGPAAELLEQAADVAEVVPGFFGADEPRRYLLVASTLSELRGSSGLLGSYALLEVSDGALRFGEFHDSGDDPWLAREVGGPADWYVERWSRVGALRHWHSANFTADFPSAARTVLQQWEARGNEPVDGVILADSRTFVGVAERSGGLDVPGIGTLEPHRVQEFVGVEAYGVFDDQEQRKAVLGAVAAATFTELLALLEDEDVVATAELLAGLAREGSVRVYSVDEDTQRVFDQVGVGGALAAAPQEFAGILVNNVAGNKVDYFGERRVHHEVSLRPDGGTRARIEATFTNTAPTDGLPDYVLGPTVDHLGPGDNESLVTLVCGTGCQILHAPGGAPARGNEAGATAVDVRLQVPAGTSRSLSFTTQTPHGWQRRDDGGIEVPVRHLLQTTVPGVTYTIEVRVPRGYWPVDLPEGAEHADGRVRLDGHGVGDLEVPVRFARLAAAGGS